MSQTTPNSERQGNSKAAAIYERLADAYPNTRIALNFSTPYELLVATILSAQCTDKRVNQVTPEFFCKFGTPELLADADIEDIEDTIKSLGMYRTKARNLKETAIQLRDRFGSEVPQDLEALESLPGVGRDRQRSQQRLWDSLGDSGRHPREAGRSQAWAHCQHKPPKDRRGSQNSCSEGGLDPVFIATHSSRQVDLHRT